MQTDLERQIATDKKQRWQELERASKIKPKFPTIKTRRRKKPQTQAIGNGYDQLEGEWLTYYSIASRFAHNAIAQDREDLLHDIMIYLETVAERKRANGEQFSEAAMYRTAEHVKDHYWYQHFKLTMGLDCQHCSKAQRRKCKEDWLYPQCPKAIKLESLNQPIIDSEGNLTELGEMIADDKAIDLAAWLDARTFLIGASHRLKAIAYKRLKGIPLDKKDQKYLERYRREAQKKLF